MADSFRLDKPEGTLVSGVEPGGPAAKAGLKTGDVILSLNGQAIVSSADLQALIGPASPGGKVTLELVRQGLHELALRSLQPQGKREASVDGGLVIEDMAGGGQDRQVGGAADPARR